MAISPYDWTQSIQHRSEYIEDRLREGSPVVGLSCPEGVLLLTVRGEQRKIFEAYDRLMLSGLGHQADLEAVRLAAIDFAHEEGFRRSPEDVTVHRVVGVALSPALKRAFGDLLTHPLVARCIFAELGERPESDLFYLLDYDGEFSIRHGSAVVAGTVEAEAAAEENLGSHPSGPASLDECLDRALQAWAVAYAASSRKTKPAEADTPSASEEEAQALARQALEEGAVEAALLERDSTRQSRFRSLSDEETAGVRARFA